ncbi:MAG: hypothetical protein JWL82_67 [Parcubacteria group bacterium]|nr:hypothetical protein [Parcubacteria group bacterium]
MRWYSTPPKGYNGNMTKNIAIGILVLIVVVFGAYAFMTSRAVAPVTTTETATTTTTASVPAAPAGKLVSHDIRWTIAPLAEDATGMPHARVSVTVDGKTRVAGTYAGTCKEIRVSGSLDGKGLLAGELSAVQCYWAGSGDEIGVFANEDGGYDLMAGELGEPTAEAPAFRGNFKVL